MFVLVGVTNIAYRGWELLERKKFTCIAHIHVVPRGGLFIRNLLKDMCWSL